MSHSTKITPTVVGLVKPASVVLRSAEIFVFPSDKIVVRKRIQRVDPLARACGNDFPDLHAKVVKQTEKRVRGLPNVVEIS